MNIEFVRASSNGDIGKINLLMRSKSIDMNHIDPKTGLSALHYAAANNCEPIVDLLIADPRTDVLLRDREGRLPSHFALLIAKNDDLGFKLVELESDARHARGIEYEPTR